jgi:hypothetical protein
VKRVAIVQSNYIPWKGYFDMIGRVDDFVLFDDVQYTHRDWRNRNRIKTPGGLRWLSIPVVSVSRAQLIRDTRATDPGWRRKHWKALTLNYARAPYFETYRDRFAALYLEESEDRLSVINRRFIEAINELLGIRTVLHWSWELGTEGRKTSRLVALCRKLGADEYLSGPAARAYIDPAEFAAAGIALKWMRYEGYPEYPQLHGPFEHRVTVLDLLFNAGPAARDYLRTEGPANVGSPVDD